jgi:hypothetical protein
MSGFSDLQKTGAESYTTLVSSDGVTRPYLYQLSAYQNSCEKVLINGRPVHLPIDTNSNQFAIVRPMDPLKSR